MADNVKSGKWSSFVSLVWYDGFIEFLFRFVAKTSEPLLAAGLVVSAADFLSKGALMRNNEMFSFAWAWTQAIAIEASSGVVFVYGLEGFKQGDKVKAWLYLVLSILLAVTGGAMLFLQFMNNTTGLSDGSLPVAVTDVLGVLRVLVSVGYVFMCRAKHIQFTALFQTKSEPPVQVNTQPVIEQPAIEDLFMPLLERMDALYSQRTEAIIERVTERVIVTIEQQTAPRLPAIPERTVNAQPVHGKQQKGLNTDKKQLVREYLSEHPEASVSQIMQSVQVSRGYASQERSRYINEQQNSPQYP